MTAARELVAPVLQMFGGDVSFLDDVAEQAWRALDDGPPFPLFVGIRRQAVRCLAALYRAGKRAVVQADELCPKRQHELSEIVRSHVAADDGGESLAAPRFDVLALPLDELTDVELRFVLQVVDAAYSAQDEEVQS